jgi:AcrR family transcriptional regulator
VHPGADNRQNLTDRREEAPRGPFDDSSRGRLLGGMVSVIAHGGYREATVERVLDAARVGWSDFNHEFEDLDTLFLATLDAGMECAVAQAERGRRAGGQSGDAEAALAAALEALLAAVSAHPQLTRLCLVESAALGARAVERKQAGLQRFVVLIAEGMRSRGGEAIVPPLAAEMVVGGIHEVLQRKARAGELGSVDALADELRQLWLPVIRASSGSTQDV